MIIFVYFDETVSEETAINRISHFRLLKEVEVEVDTDILDLWDDPESQSCYETNLTEPHPRIRGPPGSESCDSTLDLTINPAHSSCGQELVIKHNMTTELLIDGELASAIAQRMRESGLIGLTPVLAIKVKPKAIQRLKRHFSTHPTTVRWRGWKTRCQLGLVRKHGRKMGRAK